MRIIAAVQRQRARPFVLEEVELDDPRPSEVLVRLVATGVCHTDITVRDRGAVPLPAVLGHEGAGVVERVGAGVTQVRPGDHVVLSFPSCGQCRLCRRGQPAYCEGIGSHTTSTRPGGGTTLRRGDEAVYGSFFWQSSFATHALASERNTVKVRSEAPLELLGPLGCGIQTGAGAVLTTLRPPVGSSLAVFGVGSVGLSAILGAVVAGCTTIVAVDVRPTRLALARSLGATHTLDATAGPVGDALRAIAGGTDYALDTTGNPAVIRQAVDGLAKVGVCGLIGGGAPESELRLPYRTLFGGGRTLRGIIQGDSIPAVAIPALIDLYMQGRFPFDRLITFFPFAQINAAIAASERGEVVKPVLRFGP